MLVIYCIAGPSGSCSSSSWLLHGLFSEFLKYVKHDASSTALNTGPHSHQHSIADSILFLKYSFQIIHLSHVGTAWALYQAHSATLKDSEMVSW